MIFDERDHFGLYTSFSLIDFTSVLSFVVKITRGWSHSFWCADHTIFNFARYSFLTKHAWKTER